MRDELLVTHSMAIEGAVGCRLFTVIFWGRLLRNLFTFTFDFDLGGNFFQLTGTMKFSSFSINHYSKLMERNYFIPQRNLYRCGFQSI